jgi:hypothetical protein
LNTLILSIALLTGGISWIPLFTLWGINIDVENFGRLITILMLPLLFINNRFKIRADAILVTLFLWIMWTAILMSVHTGTDGKEVIRMWMIETVFAYTILNCNFNSSTPLKVIAISSVFVLSTVFAISSYIAGVDLVGETLNYLITQDRIRFLYQTLRTTFNAFTPFVADINQYSTAVMNKIAASYSLLYTILIFLPKSNYAIVNKLNIVAVAFSVICIFLLFSSSSVLMFLFSTFLYVMLKLRQNKLGIIIILSVAIFLLSSVAIVFIGDDIVSYITYQIESDTGSREGRVVQYIAAMKYIQESPIFGSGFVSFHGNSVHNWLLFSWMTGGIVSFILSLVVYFLIALKIVTVKNRLVRLGKKNLDLAYFLAALSFVFVIRTMVGGAGGVASGAGMVSFAIFMLLSKIGYGYYDKKSIEKSVKT